MYCIKKKKKKKFKLIIHSALCKQNAFAMSKCLLKKLSFIMLPISIKYLHTFLMTFNRYKYKKLKNSLFFNAQMLRFKVPKEYLAALKE